MRGAPPPAPPRSPPRRAPALKLLGNICTVNHKEVDSLASRQREAALEVFRDYGPLAPRELADQLGCSQAAARQLVRRLLKAGELRAVEGGKYSLVDHVAVLPEGEYSHPRYDSPEDSGAPDTVDASNLGKGIMVYSARHGGSIPWRNKLLEGGYDE